MIHTGRHRIKTHGGIPHGSTLNLRGNLEFYYQNRVSQTGAQWKDQGGNDNHAAQTEEDERPVVVDGGGLDFDGTNDHMNLTSFTINDEEEWCFFIVCKADAIGGCYISDSTNELMKNVSANAHQIKLTGTALTLSHGPGTFTTSADEKYVLMIYRDAASDIFITKNGVEHDPSLNNISGFDIQNLGSKNDAANFFDGKMYDVGFISGTFAEVLKNRQMIGDYLMSKHGIARLGNK